MGLADDFDRMEENLLRRTTPARQNSRWQADSQKRTNQD
jgi:hypothetical protein